MLIGVYGLNIPDSTVLSTPVKLSHMDMLKSDLVQLDMYYFPFASILFLQKDKDV